MNPLESSLSNMLLSSRKHSWRLSDVISVKHLYSMCKPWLLIPVPQSKINIYIFEPPLSFLFPRNLINSNIPLNYVNLWNLRDSREELQCSCLIHLRTLQWGRLAPWQGPLQWLEISLRRKGPIPTAMSWSVVLLRHSVHTTQWSHLADPPVETLWDSS